MIGRFRKIKLLTVDLPKQLRLAYCLVRDPRVPIWMKAAFAGGLGLLLSPWVNLPEEIPVLGELDMVVVTMAAVRLFIAISPDEVVADNEQLIIEQRSRFDEDVRKGERVALAIFHRLRPEHRHGGEAADATDRSIPSTSDSAIPVGVDRGVQA